MDARAILEWNDKDVGACEVVERLWQLSMDYRACRADPRLGALWNDARKALVRAGHFQGLGR